MPSSEVMKKFKEGKLRSGGPSGRAVKNRKQAIAIMLSERANEEATGSPDRSESSIRKARPGRKDD
jgi:hypothetical protein